MHVIKEPWHSWSYMTDANDGHTHSKVASTDLRWVNVSVEATDYRPVRLRELLDKRIDELRRADCP